MSADAAFAGCQSHPVCQDYALAGVNEDGVPYAVVCDGCTSAKHTDVGARFLAWAACDMATGLADNRMTPDSLPFWGTALIRMTQAMSLPMRLPLESLTATALIAVANRDGDGRVAIAGDGYVIGRRRGKERLSVSRYFFANEAPPYLRYLLEPDGWRSYVKQYSGRYRYQSWEQSLGLLNGDPHPVSIQATGHAEETIQAAEFPMDEIYPAKDYDLVAVASDGLDKFKQKVGVDWVDVPVEDVIAALMSFRGTQGLFVQRRFKRACDEFASKGWVNHDDFSLGVLTL